MIGSAGVLAVVALLSGAWSAADAPRYLEEIVVTAQKRETDLQLTPIAITAISADALLERDIFNMQDLAVSVPGLVHSEAVSNGQITLRGIGMDIPNLAGEPGVALHVDGVYIKSLTQATAAFSELERVEVMRGPQGTLYGRNAMGGAINLITRRASDTFEADTFIKYGNSGRVAARGAVSGPLGTSSAGRISYEHERRDGYVRNLANGRDIDDVRRNSLRSSLELFPSDSFEVIFRADYQDEKFGGIPEMPLSGGPNDAALGIDPTLRANAVQTLITGGRFTLNPRSVFHDFQNGFEREIMGVSAQAQYDATNHTVRLISAYRRDDSNSTTDSDGTDVLGLHLVNAGETKQTSHEIQLISSLAGPVNYLVGLYYLDAEDFLGINADFGLLFISETEQRTRSRAVFGEAYYQLADALKATVGARWTEDEKRFVSFSNFVPAGTAGEKTFRRFTPKFGLEYRFNPSLFGYATISKGFKAGGFDIFGTGAPFDPEEVWAYEVGLKSTLLDHRLRLNMSTFYDDYKGMQVTQFPGDGTQLISNAASARIRGVELELALLANAWLELEAAVSYLDGTFRRFVTADVLDPTGPLVDLSGNRLIRAPEFSANVGVTLTLPMGAALESRLRFEASYVDEYYFSAFNRRPAWQDGYVMTNVFLTVASEAEYWQLSLYGKNLGNEAVRASAFEVPAVGGFLDPRTYGVMVRFVLP